MRNIKENKSAICSRLMIKSKTVQECKMAAHPMQMNENSIIMLKDEVPLHFQLSNGRPKILWQIWLVFGTAHSPLHPD